MDRPQLALRREDLIVLGVALLGHVAVALLAHPAAIFDKYPLNAALIAAHKTAFLPSDASPFYLLLHGLAGTHCRGIVRALQMALGVAAALAVTDWTRRAVGRAEGIAAGLAVALAAPLVLYESTLEPDALLASFSILALWAFEADLLGVAAVAAGLAVALRPTSLLLVLLLGFWGWRRRSRRHAIRFAAVTAVVLLLPLLAVRLFLGGQMGATLSVGQVFHQGNQPEGIGVGDYLPLTKTLEAQAVVAGERGADLAHETYRTLARAAAGPELSPAACERYWVVRALAFIARHPGAWLRIESEKLSLLFGPIEVPDILETVTHTSPWQMALIPADLLYPLGAIGLLLLAWSKRGRDAAWVALVLGAPFLLFRVGARYRVVLAPLACVGAGALVMTCVACVRTARKPDRKELLHLGIAALIALPLIVPHEPHLAAARALRKGLRAAILYSVADTLRRRGELTSSRHLFQEALILQPNGMEVMDLRGLPWEDRLFWKIPAAIYEKKLSAEPTAALEFDTGVVDERAGRTDEAVAHFRRAAQGGYYLDHSEGGEPYYRAARILLRQGKVAEAREALHASLARRPGILLTLVAAQVAAERAGDAAFARAMADEAAALHDPISTAYEYARIWLLMGDGARARRALAPALAALPDAALPRFAESLACAQMGDRACALRAYARAAAALPAYPFEAARLDTLIAEEMRLHPRDPAILRLAAEHALRRGQLPEAARLFHAALDASPELAGDAQLQAHLMFAEKAR